MSTPTPSKVLLTSTAAYATTFYLSFPASPTATRLAKTREALSLIHCTVAAALSMICLYQHRDALFPTLSPAASASQPPSIADRRRLEAALPLIATRSAFANAITAFETGYLLSDSLILLYSVRLARRSSITAKSKQRLVGLNMRHLAYHHAGLSAALLYLQWYIYQGREKGVLVIALMMLMNASSPFGTVRWWLLNFRSERTTAIAFATAAYLTIYAAARVGLVYAILRVWGRQTGVGALQAFGGLRWQCKLGTGTMGFVNVAWLVMGVSNFLRRTLHSNAKLAVD
ncbi:hypothetical protein MMC34_001553 [Xylographa carneopallida]|nr:hypothetical protein [Xylographa carneopallida]